MKRLGRKVEKLTVGLAIGSGGIHVSRLDSKDRPLTTGTWPCLLPDTSDVARWGDALADALGALRAELTDDLAGASTESGGAVRGGASGSLHIALLPSLVQARLLELPRMREGELRRVLRRDASRYFLTVREPQVIGAMVLPGSRGSPVPVIAVAAAEGLIEAVLSAAARTGWRVESLGSAHAAWAAAARDAWPRVQGTQTPLLVLAESGALLLEMRGGKVAGVRRLSASAGNGDHAHSGEPASWDIAAAVAQLDEPGADRSIAIIAPVDLLDEASLALGQEGWEPFESPVTSKALAAARTPEALAACHAARAAGPELLPERVHGERRRHSVRLATKLFGLAALQLMIACALHLWGIQRELAAVVAERSSVQAQVDEVATVQTLLTDLGARLDALREVERTALPLTLVVADLAAVVPTDAHLTALRVRGDTLSVSGTASSAAGALAGLRRSAWLTEVRADGPFQQVLSEGLPPEERFSVSARLVAGVASSMPVSP